MSDSKIRRPTADPKTWTVDEGADYSFTGRVAVRDPVLDRDAVNLRYLESAISGAGVDQTADYDWTGDHTFEGGVNVTGTIEVPTPSTGSQAVNKDYVDSRLDVIDGLTTAGLGNGDFVYISAANTATKTDAAAR